MKTEGWRGKGRTTVSPVVIQMRRIKTIQASNYGMGGLPRTKDRKKPVTLPRIPCLEEKPE